MSKRLSVFASVGLALAGAGCGSAAPKVVTVTSTAGLSSTTASTTNAPLTTSTATSSPPALVVHVATFKSPSGNIGCMIIAGTARCDVKQRSWSPPPRPKSCPQVVDFGQGLIVLGSGPGRPVCAGDTTLDPSAQTLAYNTDTVVGAFRCQSRTSGIVCTNTRDGHGFFISLEAYRTF